MRFYIPILLFLLSSFASAQSLQVATSFSILEDLVKNVGGNRVKIKNFVPRNGDTHSYQASAQDIKTLNTSKLVFINGLGLEAWFSKLLQNANRNTTIIELSKNLTSRELAQNEPDPHMWWNPNKTIQYVKQIQDALIKADNQGKDLYTSNAKKYIQQLKDLDTWAKLEIQKIPTSSRKIVTNHDALGYLADHYGFKVIGTVIPGGSTERAPSAKETAKLIELIRREKVKAIFTENTVNTKLAQTIARETNAKIAPALYTDSLGVLGSSGDTYLKAFRYNINTIVIALQ